MTTPRSGREFLVQERDRPTPSQLGGVPMVSGPRVVEEGVLCAGVPEELVLDGGGLEGGFEGGDALIDAVIVLSIMQE